MPYAVYDAATGEIVGAQEDQLVGEGFGLIEVASLAEVNAKLTHVVDGEIVPKAEAAPTPGEIAERTLARERLEMRAFRLAFIRACRQTSYGPGTLEDAINATLAMVPPPLPADFENITEFLRWKPEIKAYLQNPQGIYLTDEQLDDLFRLAMALEAD